MTARLLPALQECFRSEYVSVRIEAAMVSNRALAAFKTTFSVPYSSLMTLATQTYSGKLVIFTIFGRFRSAGTCGTLSSCC